MTAFAELTTEWANLTGTTDQKLAAVNALTVAGPNADVPVSSVISYLALNAKLSNLVAYAASPPQGSVAAAAVAAKELVALFSMPTFTTFFLSQPAVYATVQVFLTAMASDTGTGILAADVTALLALAATTTPWWASVGFTSPISTNDLGGLS